MKLTPVFTHTYRLHSDAATWGDYLLRRTYFLSTETPPLEYVTSVRCICLKDDAVLVMRNRTHQHLLPGGRREAGESLEDTLRREILEESGCTLAAPTLLGFIHYHHLTPKPDGYLYPYPDFIQLVYAARVVSQVVAPIVDDWELASSFVPITAARRLPLHAAELMYLRAALNLIQTSEATKKRRTSEVASDE